MRDEGERLWGASGISGCFLLAYLHICSLLIRLSRSIKRIRVSVAVKSAIKSSLTCALRAYTYSHSYAYTSSPPLRLIELLTRSHPASGHSALPSIENPPLIPEAPENKTLTDSSTEALPPFPPPALSLPKGFLVTALCLWRPGSQHYASQRCHPRIPGGAGGGVRGGVAGRRFGCAPRHCPPGCRRRRVPSG